MKLRYFLLVCLMLTLAGCQRTKSLIITDKVLLQKARTLAHKYIIVDGHVDLPYSLTIRNFRLERKYLDIPVRSNGNFDYEKAKHGGLSAPFMSIYVPSSYQTTGGAKKYAENLIEMIEGIAKAHSDKFALAGSPQEVEANFAKGLVSLPLGMENGAPIENDLSNVAYFKQKGIRYITLTHATDNQLCDSSYDTTHTWHGISPFGKDVIKEMNRVGIMIDVSHVSDEAFYQAVEFSDVPCIASHSSCRAFTPDFKRNMSDDMIRKLAEKGGVIQLNFASTFLSQEIRNEHNAQVYRLNKLLKENNLTEKTPEGKAFTSQYWKKNPTRFAGIETVADHIDHVVKLVGINHVGFGSDFDGVGDTLPTDLKDVSQYPNLIYILLKRNYSEADIAKICYKNVWRVWNKVQERSSKN